MSATDPTRNAAPLPEPVIHDFAPVAQILLAARSRAEVLAGDQAATIESLLRQAVEASRCAVLSLDVFDTFLLRNDVPEAERYLEISRRGLSALRASSRFAVPAGLTANDMLIARFRALEASYRIRPAVEGCREGLLADVLDIVCRSLGLDEAAVHVLHEAELDYEAANLAVNPVLARLARDVRTRGGRVILLSDMYLGRQDIAEIIRRKDPALAGLFDTIVSSADELLSKRSGKVFTLVGERLALAPDRFLHMGDALQGDVLMCRQAGWHAVHLPVSRSEAWQRQQRLEAFCLDMERQGVDVRRWAKV